MAAQYLALRHVIPKRNEAVVLQYGWPSVRDDGCVIYSEGQEPAVPEGWEMVEPRVLKPVWPSCAYRLLRGRLEDSGLLVLEGCCMDPGSGQPFNRVVKLVACVWSHLLGCVIWSVGAAMKALAAG